MNSEEYLTKLHKEILSIMDEIHKVCAENKLRYYLCGGSLLGAIRHEGFIPWDDDFDIMMPRDDFETFIKIAPQKLPGNLYVLWQTTNKDYVKPFAKVCIANTLFQENWQNIEKLNTNWGIFVDVFPMDVTDDNINEISRRKHKIEKWCSLLHGKKYYKSNNILKRIIVNLMPKSVCYRRIRQLQTKKTKDAKCYTRFGSQYTADKVCVSLNCFEPALLHCFSGREYCVPNDYKHVLEKQFGPNYMKLPPSNKRRCHYPKKIVFSDGLVMEFTCPSCVISIDDSII